MHILYALRLIYPKMLCLVVVFSISRQNKTKNSVYDQIIQKGVYSLKDKESNTQDGISSQNL